MPIPLIDINPDVCTNYNDHSTDNDHSLLAVCLGTHNALQTCLLIYKYYSFLFSVSCLHHHRVHSTSYYWHIGIRLQRKGKYLCLYVCPSVCLSSSHYTHIRIPLQKDQLSACPFVCVSVRLSACLPVPSTALCMKLKYE